MEAELTKVKRRRREISKESPAVAEAFLQRRKFEELETLRQRQRIAGEKERERQRVKAIADRDAAKAELKQVRNEMKDLEATRATRHAIKTFTPESLGSGSNNAGGAKCRDRRFEVLDRLARYRVGLSPAQKNDWNFFKESWDLHMVHEYGAAWADTFAGWIQEVLDDDRSNAFSLFVHSETKRVFKDLVALHVPGN